jgi:hypothetical protein
MCLPRPRLNAPFSPSIDVTLTSIDVALTSIDVALTSIDPALLLDVASRPLDRTRNLRAYGHKQKTTVQQTE